MARSARQSSTPVDKAARLRQSPRRVRPDISGGVTGYTIVQVDDIDAAVAMAQRNPIVAGDNGTVDVVEIIEMD